MIPVRLHGGSTVRCPITAYGGSDDRRVTRAALEAWRAHTRRAFHVQIFPGEHFYLQGARDQSAGSPVARTDDAVASGLMSAMMLTWNSSPYWAIRPAEVCVWSAALDQPAEVVQRLYGLLAADERSQANRFHFDRDRRRFIVGRGVLRSILGGYLRIAPDRLVFEYGAQGKPNLSSSHASLLHFNVAHSHEWAVYALRLIKPWGSM